MSDLYVSQDFIDQSRNNLGQSMPKSHKPGPYTKSEKEIRRDEVNRLHFEYGYSARKIADLMKINRNTINGDIDFLYGITIKNYNLVNPNTAVIKLLTKLEIQRTRLREQIDKTQNHSEKIAIERLLFEIDAKLIYVRIKMSESHYRVHQLASSWLNRYSKNHQQTSRYFAQFDVTRVSARTQKKIKKLIAADQKQKMFR